jgi:hypothetical protein
MIGRSAHDTAPNKRKEHYIFLSHIVPVLEQDGKAGAAKHDTCTYAGEEIESLDFCHG